MFIKLYLIALIIFFIVDMFWLVFIAKNFYKKELGNLMKEKINWLNASVFYLLFIVGLVFFVISPAVDRGSWSYAVLAGALFGLICYATYDLSNLATLKNWPITVVVVDMVWGAFISSLVSVLTYFIVS